jgi:hypothetical protein
LRSSYIFRSFLDCKRLTIPVQNPVRRQFVYSPRDRPPADFMNIVLSFPFFLALARHHYSFEGDIFFDTQKEGWKNLVNCLLSFNFTLLAAHRQPHSSKVSGGSFPQHTCALFERWSKSFGGWTLHHPGFHPDAQSRRLERGTSRRKVKFRNPKMPPGGIYSRKAFSSLKLQTP